MFKPIILSLLITALPVTAQAESAAQFFIKLYSKTCAQYLHNPDALRSTLKESGAPQLSAKKAAFFLDDKPGTVWVVPNVLGDFVVSLDESQHCSVFAHTLDKGNARQLFRQLVGKGPLPYSVAQTEDRKKSTLKSGAINVLTYLWRDLEGDGAIKFSLLTAEQTTSEIQAKATVTPQ